jgi:GNAT superfamily N-acetyltransferase
VDIRPLDAAALADDTVMREFYDLNRRAELAGREQMPFWSFQEFLGAFRSPDSGERQELFEAYEGDQLAGVGVIWFTLLDNTDKAFPMVCVDEPWRRRGIGRALLAHLEERAAADGRTMLVGDASLPFDDREDHATVRFAKTCGYALDSFEVARHLDLPVPDEKLQAWIDEAAPHHAAYSIETYVGAAPDDLVESLCDLMGKLVVDAPTGSIDFDEEKMTPQRYAEMIHGVTSMGRARYDTLALTADREVVAHSTLAVPLGEPAPVYQWGTYVARDHRGHRLGLATKAANLRAVQQARDDLTLVVTQNAETNSYMVAINDQMGFYPVEVKADFVKYL